MSAAEVLEDRTLLAVFDICAGCMGDLRSAVNAANSNGEDDTINVAAGTFQLGGTPLDFTEKGHSVTINGAGAELTLLDGENASRIVYVNWQVALVIQGVTLTRGSVTNSNGGAAVSSEGVVAIVESVVSNNVSYEGAGGIDNRGTMTVIDSVVSDNRTNQMHNSFGGGIYNRGRLTVRGSRIANNFANYRGGGIAQYDYASYTTHITGSVITGNTTTSKGGGLFFAARGTWSILDTSVEFNEAGTFGGGIYSAAQQGEVVRSTVSSNVSASGAGLYVVCEEYTPRASSVTVLTSTISQNRAAIDGGGIYVVPGGSIATITDSTITQNEAGMTGGGVINVNGDISLANSIVAENTADRGPEDILGSVESLGHNLIGNDTGGSGFVVSDLRNVAPLLGPLQDNGGTTFTHALLPGSLAIDAGNNISERLADQRGEPRPHDGDRDGVAQVDIGAFEFVLNRLPTLDPIPDPDTLLLGWSAQTIDLTGIAAGGDETQPLAVVARSSNTSLISHPDVTYSSPQSIGTLTLSPNVGGTGTSVITVSVTDGGPDQDLNTVDDNDSVSRSFTVLVRDPDILYVDPSDWRDRGLTLLISGDNLRVVETGTDTDVVTPKATAEVAEVVVTGRDTARDWLTIDFVAGNPVPTSGVSFDAGTGADNDQLSLLNGTVTKVVYDFGDFAEGAVDIDGSIISHSGINSLSDLLLATDREFAYGTSDDSVALRDSPNNGGGRSVLSDLISNEEIEFLYPTGSLTINTGPGDDVLRAYDSSFPLVVNAGPGNDTVYGGQAADSLFGGEDEDRLYGSSGNDFLAGGSDADRLSGGSGNDTLDGADGDDILNGQSGDDLLYGGADDDRVYGGGGNDHLDAGEGRNALSGHAGDDTLQSGSDADRLYGGPGDDVLNAGDGDNTLNGQTGNDTLTGGDDDDRLYGGADDDVLTAGGGADRVRGHGGDDTLSGGEGADTIDGGSGLDWLTETIDQDAVLSNKRLIESGGDYEWVNRIARIERAILTGTARDNSLVTIDFTARVTLMGEQGDDYLVGGSATDVIDGGEGNDYLRGRQGDDSLTGGDGDDTLNGGRGSDRLFGGSGNDGLSGWTGDDLLSGNMGDDTLLGLSGNDAVMGGGGDDIALGGDDDDRINGQSGRDTVAGNAGTDVIKDDPSEIDEEFTFWAAWVDDA